MEKISIVGVGAIGGAVAAHLLDCNDTETLQLCVRQKFECIELDYPQGKIKCSAKVVDNPDNAKASGWVFIATKAHQVESAKPWLNRLCSSSTRVAVLQNGVEHEQRVQESVQGAMVLPVVVDCPAVRESQSDKSVLKIHQKGPALLTVENNDLGCEFKALFESSAIEVKLSDDIKTVAWKKLCLNVAGGAIATLTDQPLAVLNKPGLVDLAKSLIEECIAVGRCEGAQLDDDLADQIVDSILEHSAQSLTSMLVDRRAGKTLEVDARNGAVVRLGKKHQIATPFNFMATSLLAALNN